MSLTPFFNSCEPHRHSHLTPTADARHGVRSRRADKAATRRPCKMEHNALIINLHHRAAAQAPQQTKNCGAAKLDFCRTREKISAHRSFSSAAPQFLGLHTDTTRPQARHEIRVTYSIFIYVHAEDFRHCTDKCMETHHVHKRTPSFHSHVTTHISTM